MAKELVTFKDIHDYVMEESNLLASDSSASNRINRLINLVYEDVSQLTRWRWLESTSSTVVPKLYSSGLVSINNGSATLVGNASVSFTASMVSRYVQLTSESAEYKIITRSSATRLLLDASHRGATVSAQGYRIYQKEYKLPTTCEEAITIFHRQSQESSKDPLDRHTFLDYQLRFPSTTDYADAWTHGDMTSTGTRTLEIWPPARTEKDYRLNYKFVKRVTSLSATGDTPFMPKTYRSSLAYGTLEQLFTQQGNLNRAAWAKQKYEDKVKKMLSDHESTDRSLQLKVSWRGVRRRITPGRYDLGTHFDNDTWED